MKPGLAVLVFFNCPAPELLLMAVVREFFPPSGEERVLLCP
jgi:hypothetical protein